VKRVLALATVASLLLPLGFANAQEGGKPEAKQEATAKSLAELLQQTKESRAKETKLNEEREREFKSNRDQQARLLQQAEQERAAAEQRSQQLSAQYDTNDKEINQVEQLLKERAGNLGELFGVTRQVAGDAATALSQSMISAEFPDREAFLRELAGARELPSISELERLWFELQREMTESGRIAKVKSTVVRPDGQSEEAEVVRVGPFIASAEGKFLTYLPSQKALKELSRQPPARFTDAAEDLQESDSGMIRSVVDPSRGVLLALYVERPNIMERIEKGELVGYVIIAVGLIGIIAALFQLIYLVGVRLAVARQLRNLDNPRTDNPLGRVLLAFKGDGSKIEEQTEIAELRISEAVLREVPKLERFQPFLRLAVAAGPLLGLIGTVVGMIITFQSITESGSSDPKLMANGIGQAMIATVLGLGIAIPLLFANAALASLSKGVVQVLDEQSTGLLAESIERKRGVSA
jgi:biopolymer transport protein ExbB